MPNSVAVRPSPSTVPSNCELPSTVFTYAPATPLIATVAIAPDCVIVTEMPLVAEPCCQPAKLQPLASSVTLTV